MNAPLTELQAREATVKVLRQEQHYCLLIDYAELLATLCAGPDAANAIDGIGRIALDMRDSANEIKQLSREALALLKGEGEQ